MHRGFSLVTLILLLFLSKTNGCYIPKFLYSHLFSVLELGAGAALPSLIAVLRGAKRVVITDYPDDRLIQNIKLNVEKHVPENLRDSVHVEGYLWGSNVDGLKEILKQVRRSDFDYIVLSDLIFNHKSHEDLLRTCYQLLAEDGKVKNRYWCFLTPSQVFVPFSHHRPWLADKDMQFFEKARSLFHFQVEHVSDIKMQPMFKEDPGDEEMRSTVKFYTLRLHGENSD